MKLAPLVWELLLALLCLFFQDSARALNGYTYSAACDCATTTDFVNATYSVLINNHPNATGTATYTLVSTTTTRTAYIQVTGSPVRLGNGAVHWTPSTAPVPVDSLGNSLAGESEAALESFYGALDQTVFGANRSTPTGVNEPDDYAGSFINSDDSEVVPGIGYALIQMGINQGEIPAGTLITVTFSDGTSAQYIKASATATYQWTWNGVAYTSKANGHQLMYRNGTLKGNPNTAGPGGGTVTAPGFSPGGTDWTWLLNNLNECYETVSVDFGDGPIDVGGGLVPC